MGAAASVAPAAAGTATPPFGGRHIGVRPRTTRESLVERGQLESWMQALSDQGPRYTGNPAHVAFVNFLHDQFLNAGLKVQAYPYSFTRWDANGTGLSLTTGATTSQIPVPAYYVRSGSTSASGVTAPLVYGGTAEAITLPGNVSGKIVYLDFTMPPIPLQALFVPFGSYPTGTVGPVETNAAYSFVLLPGFVSGLPALGQLQSAGALGAVIGWTNISDAQLQYQYQPFTVAATQCPTLHVGPSQASTIRQLALGGATSANLILNASTYANATTETLIATLPGMTTETIVINTHTDGPNVVEENGALALLTMARYFARLPLSARQKTLVFVMATGHMDEPSVPSGAWIAQRPDIIANAVACVTIEHLGAQQWLDSAQGVYGYTGMPEYAVGQTQNTGIATPFLAALQGTAAMPTICGNPVAFFGLGAPLNSANIPTNGFIVGPAYLLTGSPRGEIEKWEYNLMSAQIGALTTFVRALDPMTASQIAGTRVPVPSA